MRTFMTRVLPLAFAILCCGCRGETQSTSSNPNNESIQVPKGMPGAQPGAPNMKESASPGVAGGMSVPKGMPGGPGMSKKP